MTPATSTAPSAEQEITGGKVGFLVAQVGRAATRRFVAALAPLGLNPRQTAMLFELRREGPMSQGALGDVLDIDPSNLVGLLNFLEEEGFAERSRDAADRRKHVVVITKHGLRQLRAVEKAALAAEEDFFGALNDEEREQLRRLLMLVSRSAEMRGPGELADPGAGRGED